MPIKARLRRLYRKIEARIPRDTPMVRPFQMLAALERAAEQHRKIFVHGTLVPDGYVVGLSPRDLRQLKPLLPMLRVELAGELNRFFERKNLTCVASSVAIRFTEKTALASGQVAIGAHFEAPLSQFQPSSAVVSTPPPAPMAVAVVGELKLAVMGEGKPAQSVVLVEGSHLVGRGGDCDLTLVDPLVSKRHCRIHVDTVTARIEDLGSTNGTFLNDRRITGPMPLGPRDRLRLGTTAIEVQV